MLTPKFVITQTEKFVVVTLHVPHIKISESEMFIEGTEFKFYLKPYYLRLNFSNEIVEDGSEHAQYDVEKGDVIIHIPKKHPGEEFADLGMITKLLAPKKPPSRPMIEIIDEDCANNESDLGSACVSPEEFTWEWDQEYPNEEQDSVHVSYGFCDRYCNYYGLFVGEFPELLDLPMPDRSPSLSRKSLLEDDLLKSFDMKHYLSDFMDINEFVGDILHYQPAYKINPEKFTCVNDEHQIMSQLPHIRVFVEKHNLKKCLIGLVDIMFSFIFDHLINCGEVSVESAWNICKLSSHLSWLYTPATLKECLILNYSRALSFPLYRHFDFCSRVLEDLRFIVSKGRVLILKCLLGILDVLRKHEFYYFHNHVFIKDYCLWIQSVDDKHIEKLSVALNSLTDICKADLPFPLDEFEAFVGEDSESSEGESETSYDTEDSLSESSSDNEQADDICKEAKLTVTLKDALDDTKMASLDVEMENMSLKKNNDQLNLAVCVPKPLIKELD